MEITTHKLIVHEKVLVHFMVVMVFSLRWHDTSYVLAWHANLRFLCCEKKHQSGNSIHHSYSAPATPHGSNSPFPAPTHPYQANVKVTYCFLRLHNFSCGKTRRLEPWTCIHFMVIFLIVCIMEVYIFSLYISALWIYLVHTSYKGRKRE